MSYFLSSNIFLFGHGSGHLDVMACDALYIHTLLAHGNVSTLSKCYGLTLYKRYFLLIFVDPFLHYLNVNKGPQNLI